MYSLVFIFLSGVMCSSLYAMQEKKGLLDHRHPTIQYDAGDSDVESGLTLSSSLSGASNTSSTTSLPAIRSDGTMLVQGSPTLTEMLYKIRAENQQKLSRLQTDINLLNVTIQSQQTQLALLTNHLGALQGKTDFLRGGKGCSLVATGSCFLALWLVFVAQYFGWSISL